MQPQSGGQMKHEEPMANGQEQLERKWVHCSWRA